MSDTVKSWSIEKVSRLMAGVVARCPFPVGSIYMNIDSSDPSTFWPDTSWVQLPDCFLLGASSVSDQNPQHVGGDTGGASSHTLTLDEMPSHNHSFTGTSVTSGGISANHTHTGTSGNPSANHNHSGPSHNHGSRAGYFVECNSNTNFMGWPSGKSLTLGTNYNSTTKDSGTGSTGNVSAWHTHTTTTGNQSHGHTHSVTASGSIGNTGGGNSFDIMPPFIAVYMWKRTE